MAGIGINLNQRYLTHNLKIGFTGNKDKNINEISEKGNVKSSSENNDARHFNYGTAGKNFVKGAISPLTNIIKHPVISIATLGAAELMLLKYPLLAPVLITAGIGLSGLQLGTGVVNFVDAWSKNQKDKMEKSCTTIGAGVSSGGLSMLGVKQNNKALSLKDGVSKTLKDSVRLISEIASKRRIPTDHAVVLMTTSNQQKLNDLSGFLKQKNFKSCKTIKVTDKPNSSNLKIRSLEADESKYGNTYTDIVKGKVMEYKPKDLLESKLQNLNGDMANLNGKTISEAFPGRRILVVADDSGFDVSLNKNNITTFKGELGKKFNMTDEESTSFINGLERTKDGNYELLGAHTHRNLDKLAKNIQPDPNQTNTRTKVAELWNEMINGELFKSNAAVAVRDVLSGETPFVSFQTTNGKINSKLEEPKDLKLTEDNPLLRYVEVVDDGVNKGRPFTHLNRLEYARGKAAKNGFVAVDKKTRDNNIIIGAELANEADHKKLKLPS